MKGIIIIAVIALVIFLAWYMMQQNGNDNADDVVNGDDIPPDIDRNTCDIYTLAFGLMMRYFDQIDREIKHVSLGTTFNIQEAQLRITLMSGSGRLSFIQRQSALLQVERYA